MKIRTYRQKFQAYRPKLRAYCLNICTCRSKGRNVQIYEELWSTCHCLSNCTDWRNMEKQHYLANACSCFGRVLFRVLLPRSIFKHFQNIAKKFISFRIISNHFQILWTCHKFQIFSELFHILYAFQIIFKTSYIF